MNEETMRKLVVVIMSLLILMGCKNRNNNSDKLNINEKTFTIQELYLLNKLTDYEVLTTKKDSVMAIVYTNLYLVRTTADFYREMTKFGQKYISKTYDEDFLYKQYKYALKLQGIKESNAISEIKKHLNTQETEYKSL